MTSTVVGLFDDMFHAQSAVADLKNAGVPSSDISVVANETVEAATTPVTVVEETESAALSGAGTGAVLGGATGLALGLAAVAVPGVGPIFAAGPLLAALSGMVLGAATGGIIGALVDIGVPETHATYYAEGVRRGGIVVTAQVDSHFAVEANRIMTANGAVDINDRVSFWKESGWSAYDPKSPLYTREQIERERAAWSARPGAAPPVPGATRPLADEDISGRRAA